MKSLLTLIILFMLTSATLSNREAISAEEKLAADLLNALRHKSEKEFLKLFPDLQVFKSMMKSNLAVYGNTLIEAENDFAKEYQERITPLVRKRFAELISSNVDWDHASVVGTEVERGRGPNETVAKFSIVIRRGGKEFTLTIERAMQIDGRWYISQFMTLV